jgi:transcriptional regulator with XRE-family HTH domain
MATRLRLTLGKRIRELRLAAGYSQESLAATVDVHRTYIGSIERGEQSVSMDNVAKIAKALRVTVAELMKEL